MSSNAASADPLKVAVTGARPASPLLSAAEKFSVFTEQQLYQTLVTLDCNGSARPDLAVSWRSDGTSWTFDLKQDIRLWNGKRLTDADLAAILNAARPEDSPVDSFAALGDARLAVFSNAVTADVLRSLASSEFSVRGKPDSARASIGTGRFRPDAAIGDGFSGRLVPSFDDSDRPIELIDAVTSDERNLLSGGVDLLVTSDPGVIDYANSLESFTSIPLPWSRTYALVSTSRMIEKKRISNPDGLPEEVMNRLAALAVPGSARAHRSGAWWERDRRCRPRSPESVRRARAYFYTSGFREIVFNRDDDIARSLAERIVALASDDSPMNPDGAALGNRIPDLTPAMNVTAKAVSSAMLYSSLEGGDDFGYIIALPIGVADPCRALREWTRRIPWLPDSGHLSVATVPLIDARAHLIVRKGSADLALDGFGRLIVLPPTEAAER